jgi:hypothetical protein
VIHQRSQPQIVSELAAHLSRGYFVAVQSALREGALAWLGSCGHRCSGQEKDSDDCLTQTMTSGIALLGFVMLGNQSIIWTLGTSVPLLIAGSSQIEPHRKPRPEAVSPTQPTDQPTCADLRFPTSFCISDLKNGPSRPGRAPGPSASPQRTGRKGQLIGCVVVIASFRKRKRTSPKCA